MDTLHHVASLRWVESTDALEEWVENHPADFCDNTIKRLLVEGLRHLRHFLRDFGLENAPAVL